MNFAGGQAMNRNPVAEAVHADQNRQLGESQGVGIFALGGYVPQRVVSNDELAQLIDTSDEWITSHLGIRTRHIAADSETSSDLGLQALQKACRSANISLEDVELLICGTYTPDHITPSLASAILRKAGLDHVAGFDVHSGGCPGGVFALDVGAQYMQSGRYRTVAIVLADVSSKILDWKDRRTSVILGDGAGCYLLRPCRAGTGIISTSLRSHPAGYYSAYVPAGGRELPVTTEVLARREQYFAMIGREVREFALTQVPQQIRRLVEESGMELDDIELFITHQANQKIVHKIMEILGQPIEKTFTNCEKFGNTASASVPLAVWEAAERGYLQAGDLIVLAAFGSGLNYGATLMRWCEPDDFLP
jgi:3-oxoacyl-[acyl-carrier-protein] synthase-3